MLKTQYLLLLLVPILFGFAHLQKPSEVPAGKVVIKDFKTMMKSSGGTRGSGHGNDNSSGAAAFCEIKITAQYIDNDRVMSADLDSRALYKRKDQTGQQQDLGVPLIFGESKRIDCNELSEITYEVNVPKTADANTPVWVNIYINENLAAQITVPAGNGRVEGKKAITDEIWESLP